MKNATSFAPLSKAPIVDEVTQGLRDPIKHLPCKLLYDAAGAELFERICNVADYYPTRSEVALLERTLPDIAKLVGPDVRVIEPGSGEGIKTRMLLRTLDRPASYVPIDVAAEQLDHNADKLRGEFPGLEVLPVLGDYTQKLCLPASSKTISRSLVFFPGSTIGNFEPDDARQFLRRFGALTDGASQPGMLLLGADSNGDREALLRAYDDSEGVTAEFDLNVLAHINRTHSADFDLNQFMHRAVWNASRSRIEMHLVSKRKQTVTLAGEAIDFERGEPIVTEHCYKHSPAGMQAILRSAGWKVVETFVDPEQRMRLWLATR